MPTTAEQEKKRLWRYRLTLIVPYLITAIILIPLIFIKKGDILVQIEVTIRQVSFHFLHSEGGLLFRSLPVKTARFVHFEPFLIPFIRAEIATEFEKDDRTPLKWTKVGENGILKVLPKDRLSSIIFEKIIFNELHLREGAQVTLTVPEDDNQTIEIIVDTFPTDGNILIGEALGIECQYCEFDGINVQDEKEMKYVHVFNNSNSSNKIDFHSDKDRFLTSIEFEKELNHSERDIDIENVSFVEGSGKTLQSSVVKGKIIFREFDDEKIQIESHDFIKIVESEALEITKMIFHNDGIELVLVGRVDELKTGSRKEFLSSQLPSVLEWIYKRHSLFLYLNTLVLIATTIIAVLQRLKITSSEED